MTFCERCGKACAWRAPKTRWSNALGEEYRVHDTATGMPATEDLCVNVGCKAGRANLHCKFEDECAANGGHHWSGWMLKRCDVCGATAVD